MTRSIMLAGVGGQGTITAAKLLTIGLMKAGYDVKMSEIHGMSQRGGSVSSHVRYGEKVHSPVIELGGADLLVAFETVEAMRNLAFLKPEGTIILNDFRLDSVTTLTGLESYPEGIINALKSLANVVVLKAEKLAAALGNPKVMNSILLGKLVKMMDLGEIDWEGILRDNIKPAYVDINIKALESGMGQAG